MDPVGIHGLSFSSPLRAEPAEPRSEKLDRDRAQAPRNWPLETSSAVVSPSNLSDQNMSFSANCIWRDGSKVLLITPKGNVPMVEPGSLNIGWFGKLKNSALVAAIQGKSSMRRLSTTVPSVVVCVSRTEAVLRNLRRVPRGRAR